MKKYLILLFVVSISISSLFAQKGITIYKEFKDYENNTGEFFEGYYTYTWKNNKISLFDNNNNIKKVKLKKVWGFQLNGNLYRINSIYSSSRDMLSPNHHRMDVYIMPFALTSRGKIFFYEKANIPLEEKDNQPKSKKAAKQEMFYSSRKLDGHMFKIPTSYSSKKDKKRAEELAKKIEFHKCIVDNEFDGATYRACAQEYNKGSN